MLTLEVNEEAQGPPGPANNVKRRVSSFVSKVFQRSFCGATSSHVILLTTFSLA